MDPSLTGKVGNKLDEASATKISRDKAAPAGKPAEQASTRDTVQLTSDAKLLEKLDKTLAALPDIDEARVADVKAAIESGDYEIDETAIAEAMLRFDKLLSE